MAIWNPGMNLRQEVDGTPQGKAIGDLFPVDWSSKTRLAGQDLTRLKAGRLGPAQTTYFFLRVKAGIKIAGRNINNLSYADDTTLMAESEEERKNLLMKVKKEC